MDFIESSQICGIFSDLLQKHTFFKCTVAWAGSVFDQISLLENNTAKIKKAVIGTHFYQTHPSFLTKFHDIDNVKFSLKPSGIFHPKLYLFETDQDNWAIIIGSHNLTSSAFISNMEASVLITSDDQQDPSFKRKINAFIDSAWNSAKHLTDKDIEEYTEVFRKQIVHLNNISRRSRSGRSDILLPEILKMEWDEYYNKVITHEHHVRLNLLDRAQLLFHNNTHFNQIPLQDRKGLAGFYDNDIDIDGFNWFAFGSMKGAGYFKGAINDSNKFISDALDEIPMVGEVSYRNYSSFVRKYLKAFESANNPTATATRLLAMKRPDYFLCLNSKNKSDLTEAFEIKGNVNLDEYWTRILERIYESAWWNDTTHKSEIESKTFSYRTAFIDNLYFEDFN